MIGEFEVDLLVLGHAVGGLEGVAVYAHADGGSQPVLVAPGKEAGIGHPGADIMLVLVDVLIGETVPGEKGKTLIRIGGLA